MEALLNSGETSVFFRVMAPKMLLVKHIFGLFFEWQIDFHDSYQKTVDLRGFWVIWTAAIIQHFGRFSGVKIFSWFMIFKQFYFMIHSNRTGKLSVTHRFPSDIPKRPFSVTLNFGERPWYIHIGSKINLLSVTHRFTSDPQTAVHCHA